MLALLLTMKVVVDSAQALGAPPMSHVLHTPVLAALAELSPIPLPFLDRVDDLVSGQFPVSNLLSPHWWYDQLVFTWVQDPGHLLLEFLCLSVILYLYLRKPYDPRDQEKLSPQEEEDLIRSWRPEPLAGPQSPTTALRSTPIVSAYSHQFVTIAGKQYLSWVGSNFLGIAGMQATKAACVETIEKYGVGSCGPRGFYGTFDIHLEVEKRLMDFYGAKACILYSDGIATLSSVIPAFSKRGDLIVCDEAVHFGIQQGIRLSRSNVLYYKHHDMEDLERILNQVQEKELRQTGSSRLNRKFIITEGISEHCGDIAPLPHIIRLKQRYKYRLILDESFALGVLGATGRGSVEHWSVDVEQVDLLCASLDHAIASVGGFCIGSHQVVDHQRLSGAGYCLPEVDHRVLTDSGFLFLSEIEKRLQGRAPVLYGCYDTATRSLVYRPGRLKYVAPPARWVDFTQAATRPLWDATSTDYGGAVGVIRHQANYLTLRTTPGHDMYVQVGSRLGGSDRLRAGSDGIPLPPHKMRAEELAPGFPCTCTEEGADCAHGYSAYRFLTSPAAGVSNADVMSIRDTAPDSPVVRLGLRSDDQLSAFLELYGYWLGNGSMSYDSPTTGGLVFAPKKKRDRGYLLGLVGRLQLQSTEWTRSSNVGGCLVVRIIAQRWLRYFDEEYGPKYVLARSRRGAATPPSTTRSLRSSTSSAMASGEDEDEEITEVGEVGAAAVAPGVEAGAVAVVCGSCEMDAPVHELLLCLYCRDAIHLLCHIPALSAVPEGDFVCGGCRVDFPSDCLTLQDRRHFVGQIRTHRLHANINSGEAFRRALLSWTTSSPPARWPVQARCVPPMSESDREDEDWLPSSEEEDAMRLSGEEDVKREDEEGRVIPAPSASAQAMEDEDDSSDPDELDGAALVPPNIKSAKWFWYWVFKRLSKVQVRLVIEGLRRADGVSARTRAQEAAGSASGLQRVCTSSVAFRDEIVQACLHAGYTAHFTVNTSAGTVRGYNAVPSDNRIYSQEEMELLLMAEPSRVFNPVQARHNNWWVHYSKLSSWLSAAEVRYDGKALQLREKRKQWQGYVAEHSDGRVVRAAGQAELGALIGITQTSVSRFFEQGFERTHGGWVLYTQAAYEERSRLSAASATEGTCLSRPALLAASRLPRFMPAPIARAAAMRSSTTTTTTTLRSATKPTSKESTRLHPIPSSPRLSASLTTAALSAVAGGAAAAATSDLAEPYSPRDGRTWCVEVEHRDHLIFVQRAHRSAAGVVTKAGLPIITGNCFSASSPPYTAKAGIIALNYIQEHPEQSRKLREKAAAMRKLLAQLPALQVTGKADRDAHSPIIHLTLKESCGTRDDDEALMLRIANKMFADDGIVVNVPEYIQGERELPPVSMALAVTVEHEDKDMERTVKALKRAIDSLAKPK